MGIDKNPWLAFFGPANLPADFVQRFNAAVKTALDAPEVKERFGQLGLEAAHTTPAGLREWVQSALAHWGPVIRESGYQLQ
jgi:tripartite-type tricarboxylate transporter receptor subunit TctC